MTEQEDYELTMKALENVDKRLRGDREASRKFLFDAGIILPDIKKKAKAKKKQQCPIVSLSR